VWTAPPPPLFVLFVLLYNACMSKWNIFKIQTFPTISAPLLFVVPKVEFDTLKKKIYCGDFEQLQIFAKTGISWNWTLWSYVLHTWSTFLPNLTLIVMPEGYLVMYRDVSVPNNCAGKKTISF
jgi:hypothetical protein